MVFGSGRIDQFNSNGAVSICRHNTDQHYIAFQGLPQRINIVFDEPITALNVSTSRLQVKFQGGFVGSEMRLSLSNTSGQSVYTDTFYPDDVNDLQIFRLNAENLSSLENVRKLEIVFDKSSDFFGRVIIYHLELFVE